MRLTATKGFLGINQQTNFKNNLGYATNMKNFRITPNGALVKRPAITALSASPSFVDGVWAGTVGVQESVFFASEGYLYKTGITNNGTPPIQVGYIGTGKCIMFKFNGFLYIKTNFKYTKYDGTTLTSADGYIPTIAISCTPKGEGEIFEEINLLTAKRRQLFSATGTDLTYTLAEKDINTVSSVTIDGVICEDGYTVDRENGIVTFETAPAAGLNNLEIIYVKPHSEKDLKRFFGCKYLMHFGGNSDGRIFLWGNKDYPNYRFHSQLANGVPSAEYFPVNAYTIIGNNKINCIVQQYDKQLIFTEHQAYYSYSELKEDSLGNVYSSFPVFDLNHSKGCIIENEGCIINNTPVTLCLDGLNKWESTTVENEKNAVCFSQPICLFVKEILKSKNSIYFFDFQANHEFYFIHDDIAYIYNYENGTWYSYDGFSGGNYFVYEKTLYFTKYSTVYAFSNDFESNNSYVSSWESPYISSGQDYGRCDVTRIDADLHIKGDCNIRFEIEKSGAGGCVSREVTFPEDSDKYTRVSFRPAIKRAMPFCVRFFDTGNGKCTLHGIIIKTREKERSSRNGVQ